MAPPKTVAISQQHQQSISQQQGDQQASRQAKPRKRKSKQQQQQQQQQQINQVTQIQSDRVEQQQVSSKPVSTTSAKGKENLGSVNEAPVAVVTLPTVVPVERTTVKKQLQHSVPPSVKEATESKRASPVVAVVNKDPVISKHQQLANEEADDVDAGIELDGSSNSGSSVKDMNEDQLKSASASPIMAQSSLINESCVASSKQMVEVAPIVQLTNSTLCSVAKPAKKISTTKQQLAENQSVIDADEQLLQEKLQNKQRKSSLPDNNSNSLGNLQYGDKTTQVGSEKTDKSTPRIRRSFSSQSSQEDASLCKICEQHVYQMERMMAEKSLYHKRCFRCYQCKIQLRVDNYSSHEGQVYCKAHHRLIFQPQVKLDNEEDVDIVAKSTSQPVDDYLLHRGRLSELSFLFLQPNPEGIRKRQMIICENEPTELPKDVVRSDTKLDDGIEQLNLNLNNILEKFERGITSNGQESQPSSSGVVIDKPSFNIKQTMMAFESKLANTTSNDESNESKRAENERPVVKKLANLNEFFKSSQESEVAPITSRPVAVKRSESLMMRLKKYESRIAGEQVDDDDENETDVNEINNNKNEDFTSDLSQSDGENVAEQDNSNSRKLKGRRAQKPKKLTSIDLSSLKNQWESGDIIKRRSQDDEVTPNAASDNNCNGNSPSIEKNEELVQIRQQLAQKKMGESGSVRNIYENAIREAQLQQKQQASRRDSSDLSALNGFSTTGVQQKLLQNSLNGTNSNNGQIVKTPTTPNKDHFQLNFSNKANKLKAKFELGLITNSSRDDSDVSDEEDVPEMTKLEQIRQEKLEDLSVFTDGEIKAREARSLFQQIDQRISAATGYQPKVNSKSPASISASMSSKLTNQMNANGANTNHNHRNINNKPQENQQLDKQPIRLTNNVRI